jgi:hypothetical protein
LPDEFILRLTPGKGHPRSCLVVWRRNQDLGVQFTDRPLERPREMRSRTPEWVG